MTSVLVLNQSYEPLAVARLLRAIVLISQGKAEILLEGDNPIQTPSRLLPRPSVIRLVSHVKRPRPHARFTRRKLFERDQHTCQYCGKTPRELTVDHILPVSRGGPDVWGNCVAACRPCNHRKGARTPEEARMTLRTNPIEPRSSSVFHVLGVQPLAEWAPYLPS